MANYADVNELWPDGAPAPSPQEALAGTRRLLQLVCKLGEKQIAIPRKLKLVSGNRRNWSEYHKGNWVFTVNPDCTGRNFSGWKGIVHDVSHWAGRRLYPGAKPHDGRVAYLEYELTKHIVNSGWLDGALKREPKPKAPVDLKATRKNRVEASIVRWQRKAKRAQNALKKLNRQLRYYQRAAETN